jgi:hypothetical protein
MSLALPKEPIGGSAAEVVCRGMVTRNGVEVREVAPSSRPGFPITGLFDRRRGGECAVPPIPDSEDLTVTHELVVRARVRR